MNFTIDHTEALDPPVEKDGKRLQGAQNVDFAAVMGNLPKGTLSREHRQMLKDSAIGDHIIGERGYRTLDDTKANRTFLSSLGFSSAQINLPGLFFPLYFPTGEVAGCQLRSDDPRLREGKPVKYETPYRGRPALDVNPAVARLVREQDEILWITEGIKKSDSLSSLGKAAIALCGVWGWIGSNGHGGTTALPEWRDIPIKGRQVRIVFDSDAATNPRVQQAEKALVQYLEGKGANVTVLRIPPGPNGEKRGADDYLSNGGLLEDLNEAKNDGKSGKAPVDELDVAECLDDGASLIFSLQKFWKFTEEKGVWLESPDEEVKRSLQVVCRKNGIPVKDSFIRGAFGSAKARFFRQVEFDRIDRRSVPAANGVLRYREGKWTLHPYQRDDYRRVKLAVVYDPSAKCPRFEQFLGEVFAGTDDLKERVRLTIEFLGLSLTSTTEYEKAIMLVGAGGNGKSVLIRVLEAMIGPWNRSAVQLKQLENRFQRAHLDGKIVNVMTELSEGGEIPDAEVKAIISGESVTAEHKLRPPFEFFPICKMWFLTNHLPSVRDLSDGLFRRFCILNFPNRFDNKPDRDTQLAEKLSAETSGILNYALKALAGVYERGALTDPPSSRQAVDGWRKDADQVAAFIEEECLIESGASVESKELYQAYIEWSRGAGIKRMLGKKNFTLRLKPFGAEPSKGTGGKRLLWGIRRA